MQLNTVCCCSGGQMPQLAACLSIETRLTFVSRLLIRASGRVAVCMSWAFNPGPKRSAVMGSAVVGVWQSVYG